VLIQGTFGSREQTTVTGGAALGRLDLKHAGWLRFAVNQRREAFHSSGVIRDVPVASGGGGGGGGGRGGGSGSGATPRTFDTRPFALDRHIDVYSSGAEWQTRPSARLAAVVGAALNWQDLADVAVDIEPTWLAGVSYEAAKAVRLYASTTRKVRAPSIDQLYSASAGNPSLHPERAYGVDAGAEMQLGSASRLGLSAFVTHAKTSSNGCPGNHLQTRVRAMDCRVRGGRRC
jgi:vitamin B12 transporter